MSATVIDGKAIAARTREEVAEARDDWMAGHDRFGTVDSRLARIDVGEPPWRR